MLFQWWRRQPAGLLAARPVRKNKASRQRYQLALEILEDRAVPAVTALSLSAEANPSSVTPTGASGNPALNSSGRFIAFQSNAINLVRGEANPGNTVNIYLYDQVLRTTTLVSSDAGNPATVGNGDSTNPLISADGRFVVYQSAATDLISGFVNAAGLNNNNVFLYDRSTATTTLVSHNNGSTTSLVSGDNTSFGPVISSDGNFIAFVSLADNLATGGQADTNNADDVLLFNRNDGSINLVSRTSAAGSPVNAANGASTNPVVSSDGSFVAFQSVATNLGSGLTLPSGTSQMFEYTRSTQTNVLVSHASASASQGANAASTNPSISGNGSLVAYQSAATNLVAGQNDNNGGNDVFLYSRSGATNALISHSTAGSAVAANGISDQPFLSASGTALVYRSQATNLVGGQQETTGATNVFLYNVAAGTNVLVSRSAASAVITGDASSSSPVLSADGNTVVFASAASNLVGGITKQDGSASDIYVYNAVIGNMRLVTNAFGFTSLTGNGASDQPVISSDGTFIAFRSAASNLISGDLNGQPDVFGSVNHTDSLVAEIVADNHVLVNISNGSSFLPLANAGTLPVGGNYTAPLIGDFNGDGHQDIAVRDLKTGIWYVILSNGSGGFQAPAVWGQWVPGAVWANVQVGDFDGNGRSEIAGRYLPNGQWWVGQSTGSLFVPHLWTTWAIDSPTLTWTDVLVGDLTGDGLDDIVGRVLQTGQWWTGVSSGSSFLNFLWTTWNPGVTWADVHIGDFTGNGKADIVGRTLDSAQWWMAVSTGKSFNNALWTQWSNVVTWSNVVVGDFNGDGKLDIAGQVQGAGQWWVAMSTGNTFNNSLWATWPPTATWLNVQAADFNGDGFADLAGRNAATGDWMVGISNGSSLFNSSIWTTWNPTIFWTGVTHGAFV
jgi:FG-GAP-like repeat/WD40-like Beta Propeller Repeat